MSELFGVVKPKKRKIQTIFLGSFNQSASLTPSDTIRNANSSASATSPPLALSSVDPTIPSSSSVPPPTNAQFSPIRRVLSPICRHRSDERRTEREIGEEQNGHSSKWATNGTTTGENEGETALLMNNNNNHSQLSLEEGNCSLNGSATAAANGEEHQPLPELNLESGAELRPVPQMCHLQQNATKGLELPAPQAQKELEFRLKLGPSAQIDRIVVQNSLSNKRTLKGARVVAKFGRDTKWQHIVPSPVLLIRSNRVWTVLCLEDSSLVVLLSQSGRVSCSLLIPAVLSLLELRDHFCLAIGTDATAQLWDLQLSQSLFRTSIRSLFGFSSDIPRIVHTFVSAKGLPVIVLSNGDAFAFSSSLQSWLSLPIGRDFVASKLCSMQSIAKVLPDGLIAALLGASKIEKASSSNSFSQQRAEMAEAKEESEMEMLLRMTRELTSWEEFRLLTVLYAQLLLSREKRAKLVEFLAELRSLSQTHDEFPLSTIVADLRPLLAKRGEGGVFDFEGLFGTKGGRGTETAKGRERKATTDGETPNATDRTMDNLLFAD
ncbi:hypothetical protein niasHS_002771 [Heterodera schachtii]|uniref:Protein HIRA-like C-terminal domain-containing protein n=1 Tax=Heterodera schachtii TaxID=97005 RepID=A0ABD2K2D5_HETSC